MATIIELHNDCFKRPSLAHNAFQMRAGVVLSHLKTFVVESKVAIMYVAWCYLKKITKHLKSSAP